MNSARSFLGRSLALSLILHAVAIALGARLAVPTLWSAQPALTVWLPDRLAAPEAPTPAATPPEQPQLLLPRHSPPNASAAAPAAPRAVLAPRLWGEAAFRANEQLRHDLPYPPEAIERGLQGEALVLLFLDAAGNVIAARLESSSGHVLLDDAAVRAARSLRSLPDSAPREALLPVRFRLR